MVLKLGFYVFPIVAGAKTPACMWRTESTKEPKAWPGNWGVDCGKSKLLVLDLDMKDGRNGLKDLRQLAEASRAGFPETMTVRTPTGGIHLYFVSPGGYGNGKGSLPKSVDVRGEGGYVLAPGSKVSGREYVRESSLPPGPLPAWVADLLTRRPPGEKVPNPEDIGLPDASEAVVRQAVEHVRAIPPAETGERNEKTFCLAADLRATGLSERQTVDVVMNEWVPRLPAWDDAEALACVRNAYRYADPEAFGNADDAFILEPEEAAPTPANAFFSTPPVREWVVEGWIPADGATLLAGAGGVGKSQLMLQLAACVAEGLPFLGSVTKKLPVLYVACEDTKDELHRRTFFMRSGPTFSGMMFETLLIWPRVGEHNTLAVGDGRGGGLKAGRFLEPLRKQLAAMAAGRKLLILDTVPDVYFGSENDRMAVNTFVKEVLGGISKRYQATIVCAAHPAKNVDSEYSGSTAWNGAFRSRITMKFRDPEHPDDYRVLKLSKSNYGAWGGQVLVMRDTYGVFQPEDSDRFMLAIDTTVYAAVSEAVSNGNPLSLKAQAATYVLKCGLRHLDDKLLSEAEILESVRRLLAKGQIEERSGNRGKSANGLFPKSRRQEDEEQGADAAVSCSDGDGAGELDGSREADGADTAGA